MKYINSAFMAVTVLCCVCASNLYAQEKAPAPLRVVARDPAGHGLLCVRGGKRYVLLKGTPEEMGAAQGRLLSRDVKKLCKKMYVIGAGYTMNKADWFFERIAEVEKRTGPHTPKRFIAECDALAKAAGVDPRDLRYGNFFPEMFHCSGFAVRNAATKDGMLLHARVLDYMTNIRLQELATVTVFMPEKYNAWVSLGYAGFIGTVTAMNEKGLAIGEIGGRGEGDWDGMPMNFLLREIMEKASTVDEALKIIHSTPRTCIYHYVISDSKRNMVALRCTSKDVLVLKPGEQHDMLPFVPQDTVLLSGGNRVKHLSKKLTEMRGKIDVQEMINIMKRPVAMRSNLHNAVFRPETLDMWFADATRNDIACNQKYRKCNLKELMKFYNENITPPVSAATH